MYKVIVKSYCQISSCQDWGDVSATNSDLINVDFGKLFSSANNQEFGFIVIEFQLILYHPCSNGVNTYCRPIACTVSVWLAPASGIKPLMAAFSCNHHHLSLYRAIGHIGPLQLFSSTVDPAPSS